MTKERDAIASLARIMSVLVRNASPEVMELCRPYFVQFRDQGLATDAFTEFEKVYQNLKARQAV